MGLFTKTHRDPVCGMKVTADTAMATALVDGKTYYFCSHDCQSKFKASPAQYS